MELFPDRHIRGEGREFVCCNLSLPFGIVITSTSRNFLSSWAAVCVRRQC